MNAIALTPGAVPLHIWRRIYEGDVVTLDPACRQGVAAAANLVAAIVEKGEPVYGINTGFGKLATVKIEAGDIATLQRNLVLACGGRGGADPTEDRAADDGAEACKLAQGASGVRMETLELLGRCSQMCSRSCRRRGRRRVRDLARSPI